MEGTYTTGSISTPPLHHDQCSDPDTDLRVPSSSVHTRTTTVDALHVDSPMQNHRFRTCLALRTSWLASLSPDAAWSKIWKRFIGCGANMWIQYSPTRDSYRTVCNSCNLRFCPICSRRLGQAMATSAAASLATLGTNDLKFITLTLRSSSAPLDVQLQHLRKAFRRLRQRQIWKKAVLAGVAVIELTFSAQKQQWHPHLHIIAKSAYIPQHHLKAAWFDVTNTSTIVDIRPCRSSVNLTNYLCKYLGKPPPLDRFADPMTRLSEYRTALTGARMLIKFGKFSEVIEPTTTDDAPPNDWQQYQPMAELLAQVAHHDPTAIYVFQRLSDDTGYAQTSYKPDPPLSHHSPQHLPPT